MKIEIQEKDRFIEELKRNVRLSRQNEGETELQVYIDECMRLRSLLEQTMIQNDALATQ
jgi:quinol monooxygenase YgiN